MRLRISMLASVLGILVLASSQVHGQGYTRALRDLGLPQTPAELDAAIARAESARDQIVKRGGNADTALAAILDELALYRIELGQFTTAESLATASLRIREQVFGAEHLETSKSVLVLARSKYELLALQDAERLYRRAVAILERHLGPDHLDVARALDQLVMVYLQQYRSEDAEQLLYRTMSILRAHYPDGHPAYASALTHIADANFFRPQRRSEVDSLYALALEIAERAWGADDLNVATILYAWGWFEHSIGRHDSALVHEQRGLAIRQARLKANATEVLESWVTIVRIYAESERYREADSLRLIVEEMPLPEPVLAWETIIAQMKISLFLRTGRARESLEAAWQSFEFHTTQRDRGGSYMTDDDLMAYSRAHRSGVYSVLYAFWALPERTTADSLKAIEVMLSGRGWINEAMVKRHDVARADSSLQVGMLIDSIAGMQTRLASMFARGAFADTASPAAHEFASISTSLQELETRLAERVDTTLSVDRHRDSLAGSISRHLPIDAAVVDYSRARPHGNISHYYAVIIEKGHAPALFDLGPAAIIDSMIEGPYRDHIASMVASRRPPRQSDAAEYREIARKLYDALWLPIASRVATAKTVLVAPDNRLNGVSFGALVGANGQYVIERHAIHYLNAARDVLRFREPAPTGAGILIVEDLDSDAAPVAASEPVVSSGGPLDSDDEWQLRSFGVDCNGLNRRALPALKCTRIEGDFVSHAWAARSGEPIRRLPSSAVLETKVREECEGKRIIHFATHGYAIDATCGWPEPTRWSEYRGQHYGDNPLLMSGMVIGRTHGDGPSDETGQDDGVLTAQELSSFDLDGVELAVLSGCETALGPTRSSDGVFGLRRALQYAGARTVVCALWAIPDRLTPALMRRIYESPLPTYPAVMRETALQNIREIRSAGLPDHPLVWGAFIAVGDWKKSW